MHQCVSPQRLPAYSTATDLDPKRHLSWHALGRRGPVVLPPPRFVHCRSWLWLTACHSRRLLLGRQVETDPTPAKLFLLSRTFRSRQTTGSMRRHTTSHPHIDA